MSRAERLERASADHRREVAACATAIRALDPASWGESARPGGWTRAEIAEHLAVSYDPPLSELTGGPGFALRLPWWKRSLVRWKVMPSIRRGRFPSGAPAPKEIRPKTASPDREQAAIRLASQADRFLAELELACRRGRVRLTHAYMGRLSAPDSVVLLTSHLRHHCRQLTGTRSEEES
jgi:hypothetical protein